MNWGQIMQNKDNLAVRYLMKRLETISQEKETGFINGIEIQSLEKEEKEVKEALKVAKTFLPNFSSDKPSGENYGIKILEQQENERQRIARELHDSTVQVLTNLVHKTELCSKIMDIDLIRAKLELEIINNTIRYTINDMRNIIHNLRPMAFDDFGLDITLERVVGQIKANTDIQIHVDVVGEKKPLSSVVSLTLVRIMQEACNNSIKHSQADNVYITFSYEDENVLLSIKDDGKGFDIKNTDISKDNQSKGFGVSIMKERAMLLSGEFKITSSKNKGTHIMVTVPIV